jgi:hypothetical protein
VTASAYGYEGNPTESTTASYFRTHAAVRLQARDLGHEALSLTTFLRGTTDLAQSDDAGPRLRVYNLFLRYDRGAIDARAGRQRIFAGVGSGTIDGARLALGGSRVGLQLFGGALAPLDDEGLGAWSEGSLWGARLNGQLLGVDLAASYADRQREPIRYATPGRYSGFVGTPEAVRRQLVGVQAYRRFGLHSLRGRVDYDLQDEGLRRGEVAARVGLTADLAVIAEWRRREPDLYAGSILSVFPSEGYDETALRLHYRLSPQLALGLSAAQVAYDDDDSQRLGLSATIGRSLTISYARSQGYAGDNDGLSGSLHHALTPQITLRGQLGLSSYERFEDDDREGLVSAVAGVTWRPSREFSFDTQVQGLRNPSYDTDMRLLLRGSWRFRQ